MSVRGVDVLVERIEQAVKYALTENEVTYAELLGALELIKQGFVHNGIKQGHLFRPKTEDD